MDSYRVKGEETCMPKSTRGIAKFAMNVMKYAPRPIFSNRGISTIDREGTSERLMPMKQLTKLNGMGKKMPASH